MTKIKEILTENRMIFFRRILVLFVLSGFYFFYYQNVVTLEYNSGNVNHRVIVGKGIFHYNGYKSNRRGPLRSGLHISLFDDVPSDLLDDKFVFQSRKLHVSDYELIFRFPLWIIFLPIFIFILMRIYKKIKLAKIINPCESCQYDLTGNTSGKCPECGTKILSNKIKSENVVIKKADQSD